jgi:hypothetical protein
MDIYLGILDIVYYAVLFVLEFLFGLIDGYILELAMLLLDGYLSKVRITIIVMNITKKYLMK